MRCVVLEPCAAEERWVHGDLGWREYVVARDGGLFGGDPVPDGIDPRHMLTVFG